MSLSITMPSRFAARSLPPFVAALVLGACSSGSAPPPDVAARPAPTPAVLTAPVIKVAETSGPVVASTVADLVEVVAPTVVNITTVQKVARSSAMSPFDLFFPDREGRRPPTSPRFQQRTGAGTGFIIDGSGYVITNEHVVRDADEVRVTLVDDRQFTAEVVGRDAKLDLALLKLDGADGLPGVTLGSSDVLRVGEQVLAVGNPFGLGHTVTLGIVSAKARSIGAGPYDDFIQTDASINPGNSGGPLFNLRGEVVGINTAIRANADGIGFAIPIESLRDILGQLKQKGYVERGKLGLAFQPMTPDIARALGMSLPHGAMVTDVEAGTAAARAGIRPGDVIVAISDVPIRRAEELPRNVARHAPGSTIAVTLMRDGKEHTVAAALDKLEDETQPKPTPAPPSAAPTDTLLGVEVADDPRGGVRVGATTSGNPGGLRTGDVIVELNGHPIRNVAELRAAMGARPGSGAVLFKVRRGSRHLYVGVPTD